MSEYRDEVVEELNRVITSGGNYDLRALIELGVRLGLEAAERQAQFEHEHAGNAQAAAAAIRHLAKRPGDVLRKDGYIAGTTWAAVLKRKELQGEVEAWNALAEQQNRREFYVDGGRIADRIEIDPASVLKRGEGGA